MKQFGCNIITPRNQTTLPPSQEKVCFDQADSPTAIAITARMDSEYILPDMKVLSPIYVHSQSDRVITPQDIIKEATTLSSSNTSVCAFDDEVYTVLFNAAIDEFIYMTGSNKINTFLVKIPLVLNRKEKWYNLPGDFHTQSNLFIKKECCLYNRFQRFNFQPFEAWEENNVYYTYTINNNRLYIKIPDKDIDEACDSCIASDGTSLMFEYYMTPGNITSLNEPLFWLPKNRSARRLMIEIFRELLAEKDGQSYLSPNKLKWFTAMLENTNGINNVDSNKRIGRTFTTIKRF